jgi:hypothetical protein
MASKETRPEEIGTRQVTEAQEAAREAGVEFKAETYITDDGGVYTKIKFRKPTFLQPKDKDKSNP